MGKIDSAINWAVAIANDNSHGYSQSNRWGPPLRVQIQGIQQFWQMLFFKSDASISKKCKLKQLMFKKSKRLIIKWVF